MEIYGKKVNTRSLSALFALMACLLAFMLFGCSQKGGVSLTAQEITLCVGERRDIYPYAVFSDAFGSKELSINADGECVTVSGTVVTAVSAGSATLTVRTDGGSAQMRVTVVYPAARELNISADGLEQTVVTGAPRPVHFAAELDDTADPALTVEWSVNGEAKGSGMSFDLTPPGHGEYTVRAECGRLFCERTVRVYRQTPVTVTVEGERSMTDGVFTPVRFTARETRNMLDPLPVFDWRVNGAKVGSGRSFELVPEEAGEYAVSLYVNGVLRQIEGGDEYVVTASGAKSVRAYVDIDGADGVCVRWTGSARPVRISVISPDGRRKNYDLSDAQYAYRFGSGAFNAQGLIEPCAADPGQYRLIVAAEATCEIAFLQYPLAAADYITNRTLLQNSFITDRADAAEWVAEQYVAGKSSARCYIARDITDAAIWVAEAAVELGLDPTLQQSGSILHVNFGNYVHAPSVHEEVDRSTMLSLSSFSELPHIEYDEAALRGDDYTLAADRLKRSVAVSGSEALLYAITRGVRPLPEKGSVAAHIYRSARTVLLEIIGADYSPRQKVHAIYDWLQWTCITSLERTPNSCGRFLEGVFGSPEVEGAGSLVHEPVTDEGAAKAFALLCGMEGIRCSVKSCVTATGRSYMNIVELDGNKYIVDVMGGKSVEYTSPYGRPYEYSTHSTLLMDGLRAAELGYDIDGGEQCIDSTGDHYAQRYFFNGMFFDYYILPEEVTDSDMLFAAMERAFLGAGLGTVRIPSVSTVSSAFAVLRAGVEFYVGELTAEQRAQLKQKLYVAANEYSKKHYDRELLAAAIDDHDMDGKTLHIRVAFPVSGRE